MLDNNIITKLIGMEDAIIDNVAEEGEKLVVTIHLPREKHQCPVCKEWTDRIHDYRNQDAKDLDISGREVVIRLRKRRYICTSCGKRFAEKNPYIKRYQHTTQRMFISVLNEFRNNISAKKIASDHHISTTTAFRYFEQINYGRKPLPEVLSIDEFRGNSGGEKFNCILADAKHRKILDILPNRKEEDLMHYFIQCTDRKNVKYFVTDMNSHFERIQQQCFPWATLIVDRYHVIRQVYWAMNNVRKREQSKLSSRYRKYFKRSKHLLGIQRQLLKDEEKHQLALMFEIAPELATAYNIKNLFVEVMHSKNSTEGKHKLKKWLIQAEFANIPEFDSCIKCYQNWHQAILNTLDVPYSNGFTEGANNKTKVLKRTTYGMRNFNHFRNRILHMAA